MSDDECQRQSGTLNVNVIKYDKVLEKIFYGTDRSITGTVQLKYLL